MIRRKYDMLKEILIKSVKWKVWTWCVPSLGGLVLILMFGHYCPLKMDDKY